MSGGGKNPLMALCLRILVAGYLAYLGLQIWPEKDNIMLTVASVFFLAAGAAFGIWAILKFKRDGGSEGGEE
jgi:hypothetical protein